MKRMSLLTIQPLYSPVKRLSMIVSCCRNIDVFAIEEFIMTSYRHLIIEDYAYYNIIYANGQVY